MTTQGCHCERSEAISFSHLAEAEMRSSIRALALLIAAAAVFPGIAVAADASLSLPEVSVTAPPITPAWKKWNPYGGSIRVEEDKWPDIPCSASRIAAGAVTGCKTGPQLSYAGVGLPGNDRAPDLSNCKLAHDLVMTNLGVLAVEADVIVVDPYLISAIGPQHKGCAAQAGYGDPREDFPDLNQMTRNGGGWRNFAETDDLTSMGFSLGRDNCVAFEKRGPPWKFGHVYVIHASICRKDGGGIGLAEINYVIAALLVRTYEPRGNLGFIGLGNMGGPMALNLAKGGFELVVHDIDPRKLDPLVAAGAAIETSPAAVAGACDRTICMVETTDQAEAVIIGEQGVISRAQAGHIVLCMSTIDPFAARRFERRLAERGIAMLDAPVSGGTVRAKSGELSIIVGGAPETYAACEDLFRAMGKNLFHVGALGHGLAMKLLNNMLGQIQTVAIAEALVYGVKAGLDPQKIYEVIRVSTGSSVQFENRVPRMLKRDFTPGGTIDISYKDQELETAFAKRLGVPLLLANVSQQVYQMARAQGLNKEDGSAIIKLFEKLAGVTVGDGDDRRSGFD